MKLPNNYGSVYKLSGKRRNPFAARITTGYNYKGYAVYKFIGYYTTKKEALEALAEYNRNPYDLANVKSTLADIWEIFKQRKFASISDSGKSIYNAAYKHLSPLHDISVKDIKTYQIQSLIDSVDRGWQTKSHIQTLLHQLFDIAIELDIVGKNYAEFVKLPEKEKSNIHKPFSEDEIRTLFNNVFSYEWADTVLMLIYTGMRPSELLNIKISDVHLEEKYMVGGLKTKAGKNRIIPISDKVLPFVKKRYNPDNTFLIEYNNKPVSYNAFNNNFKQLMSDLNMEHLPHDGRHTFASMANTAGVNTVSVKLIMGHSSQDITESVYTHKAVKELLTAVNAI